MLHRSKAALSLGEWLAAFGVLSVVAALTLGPHIASGGLFYDDWADAAGRFYPPGGDSFGNVMSNFWHVFHYRPGLVVFTPLKYSVLGADGTALLVWTALLAVVIAAMLYGVLRRFSMPCLHALCIAALTIVFPWFDSTRLWESANPAAVSIAIALAGFWIALVGVSRRSWRLHACALVLYAASILTYELTLPLILAAGVVYASQGGWAVAKGRWGADIVVVILGTIWVRTHTTRAVSGLSQDLTHLREMVDGGKTIVARAFDPLGPAPQTALALALATAILLGGVVVYLLLVRGLLEERDGWGLREWLLLAVAGLVVTVLGWAVFIPADPYYTPSIFGITNRVNALAGYGLVLLTYALIGIVCAISAAFWPPLRRYTPVGTVVISVLLGATYVHVLERHIGIWKNAAEAQAQAISTMKRSVPRIPPGTTVFASGYPAYETLGVPIFATTWDVNGMVKLEYQDGTLSGYPVVSGMELECRAEGVGLGGAEATPSAPYGTALLLDFADGEHSKPRDRRQCLAVAGRYVPGPFYLMSSY